jgi:chromosomal replication initiator protein
LTDTSLQAVGKMLGKRDHSTVLHGVRKIEKDLETNSSLQGNINVLIKKIDPSN